MQTILCVVRHGVTDWNYDGRAQGHVDIPLNDEGLRQAETVARRLASEQWDAIYSSPLQRAHKTAQVIGQATGLPVRTDGRLKERTYGQAEGITAEEREARWPGVPLLEIPGVETEAEVVQRALAALTEVAERHPGERVICVSHGSLIRAVIQAIQAQTGAALYTAIPGNTSLTLLQYENGRFALVKHPDHSHLLVEGADFTGEKMRVKAPHLAALAESAGLDAESTLGSFRSIKAVESAWVDGTLVGLVCLVPDTASAGYSEMAVVHPRYRHLLPYLNERLRRRYPAHLIEQAGD